MEMYRGHTRSIAIDGAAGHSISTRLDILYTPKPRTRRSRIVSERSGGILTKMHLKRRACSEGWSSTEAGGIVQRAVLRFLEAWRKVQEVSAGLRRTTTTVKD